MHDFVGRLIDDSYEKLFLDDMPIEISEIDGCIGYEELVKQCLQQLGKSNKKKVVVIKVGEMFDVILINEITKILQENFKDKKFILLVDDYRKLNLDFPLIESMAGWPTVIEHAKEHDGEEMDSFKQINNHQRNKLFLSRNNKGKEHRREWVKFLEKHNIKEKGFVSEGWNRIFLEHLNDDPINTVEPFESIGYNSHNQRYPSRDDKSLMSFYNDSFCEVVTSSECKESELYGCFDSEKEWRPFLFCVIPQIIIFANYDDYLRQQGFDLFDDVLDTSFYKIEDLEPKFEIIKNNLDTIEKDLVVDKKFREDIWIRLKNNQKNLFKGWKQYFYRKIDELENV